MKNICFLVCSVLILWLSIIKVLEPDKSADCYCLNCERGNKTLLECYICCDDKCLNTATDCHDYCDSKTKCINGKPEDDEKVNPEIRES